MLSTGAACWFCVVSPAAANPVGYGIPLVTAAEQPEQRLWELWLPYTGGFALWFNCLLIRMHNLFVIHVKQSLPFALALQLPVLTVPWVLAAAIHLQAPAECNALPSADPAEPPFACALDLSSPIIGLQRSACETQGGGGRCGYLPAEGRVTFPQLTQVLHLAVAAGFLGLFLRDSKRLLPLFREIPDLLPNILFGVLSLLCIIGLHVARLVGLGYANPEGRLSVVIPVRNLD